MRPPAWRRTALAVALAGVASLLLAAQFRAGRRPVAPVPSTPSAGGIPTASPPSGLWTRERSSPPSARPPGAQLAAEQIAALPYLQGYRPAPARAGVTIHEHGRAQDGLNLVVSGHGAEASLIDMQGRRVHTWRRAAERVWPEADPAAPGAQYWRRARAFANGDLLAIFDGVGLVRLDHRSRVIWAFREDCHHDVFVDGDGTVFVLTRELRLLPDVHPTRESLEEQITVLSADGRLRRTVSLYAAFRASDYAPLLGRVSQGGDIFHVNTLVILDGSLQARWPVFARGRALVSLRNLDTVAVVDLEAGKVVWALTGLWRAQHEPSLLASGRLLVFDNLGRNGRSRVIEIDPFTQQVWWKYPADGASADLLSETSGTARRLANGNTLITESTAGRALEVAPDGTVVWEFWNPHRAGAQRELIATLLDVVRLDPGFGRGGGWLGAEAAAASVASTR